MFCKTMNRTASRDKTDYGKASRERLISDRRRRRALDTLLPPAVTEEKQRFIIYQREMRERLVSDRLRRRALDILPTITEEERKCITYQEKFGITLCLPSRPVDFTNDEDENDDAISVSADIIIYGDEKELYLSAKTRKAFNGRQEKRCAGKLEVTKIFAQQVKKTAKIIASCAGLATTCTGLSTCTGPETVHKERSSPKPTKSDLRFTTNKLRAKRAYKIQQACACICDRALLKSVGCNCI